MTKLLIATDTYFPKRDGVVVFLNKIIPKLTDKFEITILAPAYEEEIITISNTKIIGLPVSKRFKLADYHSIQLSSKNINRIKQAVKEADIVWSQDIVTIGAFAIYYAKKFKKPNINYVHQITEEHVADLLPLPRILKPITHFFIRRMVKYLYNKCDLLLVPYKSLAHELADKGIKTKKAIITLGVDSQKFIPSQSKMLAKKALRIDPKYTIIGYCGRLSKEKDIRTLIRAYLRLKEFNKNIFLLLVGNGPEKNVGNIKERNDVKITGFVSDVVPYLQAMDIFVLPSSTETTSLSTLEAMSCKLPVVVTRVGYLKEYIEDKKNGIFFPVHNDYVLRRKLEKLVNNEPGRKMLGENARETVLEQFSWEKTVKLII
ncbi:glycosyltransferase family 4 protein, partial [Candidatus Woesearchaeota archaeon]|nr:glycosyltransferase family 4 protein [Candidatus Woesearchaeota archaeon]